MKSCFSLFCRFIILQFKEQTMAKNNNVLKRATAYRVRERERENIVAETIATHKKIMDDEDKEKIHWCKFRLYSVNALLFSVFTNSHTHTHTGEMPKNKKHLLPCVGLFAFSAYERNYDARYDNARICYFVCFLCVPRCKFLLLHTSCSDTIGLLFVFTPWSKQSNRRCCAGKASGVDLVFEFLPFLNTRKCVQNEEIKPHTNVRVADGTAGGKN